MYKPRSSFNFNFKPDVAYGLDSKIDTNYKDIEVLTDALFIESWEQMEIIWNKDNKQIHLEIQGMSIFITSLPIARHESAAMIVTSRSWAALKLNLNKHPKYFVDCNIIW